MAEREQAKNSEEKGKDYKAPLARVMTIEGDLPVRSHSYRIEIHDEATDEVVGIQEGVKGYYVIADISGEMEDRFVTMIPEDDESATRVLLHHSSTFASWLKSYPTIEAAMYEQARPIIERIRSMIFS